MDLPHDALPNLGSWKADTYFLGHIVSAIEQLKPATVVELGCGASSLVMAEASELTDDRGRRIVGHADTMRRHIDRRLGGASPRLAVAGQRTPVHPVVEGIVQTLTRLHPTREIDLDAPAELVFPGPREDLEEIAGNLLENACKWARHRVRFRAREDFDASLAANLKTELGTMIRACEAHLAEARSALDEETVEDLEAALAAAREARDARDGASGMDRRRIQGIRDELERAALPLAALLMDSVAKRALTGKKLDEV